MDDFHAIALLQPLGSVLAAGNDGLIQLHGNFGIAQQECLEQIDESGIVCQLYLVTVDAHAHKETLLVQAGKRSMVQASSPQPARKAAPPIGVIAPSQRMPVRLSTYRLPEKTMMPAMNR